MPKSQTRRSVVHLREPSPNASHPARPSPIRLRRLLSAQRLHASLASLDKPQTQCSEGNSNSLLSACADHFLSFKSSHSLLTLSKSNVNDSHDITNPHSPSSSDYDTSTDMSLAELDGGNDSLFTSPVQIEFSSSVIEDPPFSSSPQVSPCLPNEATILKLFSSQHSSDADLKQPSTPNTICTHQCTCKIERDTKGKIYHEDILMLDTSSPQSATILDKPWGDLTPSERLMFHPRSTWKDYFSGAPNVSVRSDAPSQGVEGKSSRRDFWNEPGNPFLLTEYDFIKRQPTPINTESSPEWWTPPSPTLKGSQIDFDFQCRGLGFKLRVEDDDSPILKKKNAPVGLGLHLG